MSTVSVGARLKAIMAAATTGCTNAVSDVERGTTCKRFSDLESLSRLRLYTGLPKQPTDRRKYISLGSQTEQGSIKDHLAWAPYVFSSWLPLLPREILYIFKKKKKLYEIFSS